MRKKHLYLIKGKRKERLPQGKKKAKKFFSGLIIIFLALFAVRFIFSFILNRTAAYLVKTHIVWEQLIEDKFAGKGLIIRDEKVVIAPQSGYLFWGVPEGSRIGVGKVAAELVQEIPQEFDNDSKRADNDAAAKYSGETSCEGTYQNDNTCDFAEMEYQTSLLVNQLRDSIINRNMREAQGYYERLKSLSEQLLLNNSSIYGTGSQIIASLSGMVVYFTDGLEGLFHSNNIEFLSARQLKDIAANPSRINFGEKVEKGLPLLKIVDNYSWYFIVPLTSNQVNILSDKNFVNLKFAFAPEEEVRAEVYNIKQEEEDGYLVTFLIKQHIENFHIKRESEVEIIYNCYKGIKVPVEAIVYKDEQPGVYFLEKATVRFCPVQVIRQIEEELLLEGLSPGQCIITNPKFFREGQYVPRDEEEIKTEFNYTLLTGRR